MRPRWIAALVLALAVAGGFAALGQWQLERSIATGEVLERTTEKVVPLTQVAEPQSPVTGVNDGQLVEARGAFRPGEFLIVQERLNRGEPGFWVLGHFATTDDEGLAVAVGWAPTRDQAETAMARLEDGASETRTVSGRYLASEPPQESDFESGTVQTVSLPALVNLWPTADEAGVYGGYVVADDAPEGLAVIDSPTPEEEIQLNWLNIFYAAEWVVFAGFAVFLWYRLVKDAWEAEEHEKAHVN